MKHFSNCKILILLSALIALVTSGCKDDLHLKKIPAGDMQTLLNQTVAEGTIPGAILGVKTPSEIWTGVAGKADTSSATMMTKDMQVQLASVTKPLTAVLTMKLVEEEVLLLEDEVEKWLPEVIQEGDKITIKMLLNHSGGIADATQSLEFWQILYGDPEKEWSYQDILSISNPDTPAFSPGTEFSYSNTGYYLLGLVIEAATSRTVSSLFLEKIAQPAQLNRTALTRAGEMEAPCLNGYTWLFTSEEVVSTEDWNFSWDWTAGAGVSTAEDMLRFADMLFKGEILNQQTVELMTSQESFAPGANYGLGLSFLFADDPANLFGTTLIGWSGANPGTATQWYYMPEFETTIFVAVNRHDIPEGPGGIIPANGTKVSGELFINAWNLLEPGL